MVAIFPYLPGVTWPVDRKPMWSTTKQTSVSGKSSYFANQTQPRYQYSLSVSGLDANGQYPGLVAQSKQALEALFNQCNGGASIFYFWDPFDNSVVAQPFGTGDGTTNAFQLYRTTAGGWNDAIFAPLTASAPVLVAGAGAQAYAPNNLLIYSGDLTQSAWNKTTITVTGGVSDPLGGTAAQTLTATAANGFIDQFSGSKTGPNYVSSLWARRRAGAGLVKLSDPAHDGGLLTLPLTSSWQRFSIAGAPSTSNTIVSLINIFTSGDAVDVYAPQLEQSLVATPGPYIPTLSAAAFGQPQVSVAGALLAPSAYSVSTSGVVTFNTPPANGAALSWTGSYYWPCNFDADTLDLSQIMSGLWQAAKLSFTTRIY